MADEKTRDETGEQTRSLVKNLKKLALALMIGSAGGQLFVLMGTPLPWLLGAMTFCMTAALLGAPVMVPRAVRIPMTAIIGVMLGSRFEPDIFSRLTAWIPTLLWLAAFVLVAGTLSVLYFRYVGRFDKSTAFFSGMPGGFMEMILMAESHGAKVETVALTHASRVFLMVLLLPFVIEWFSGAELGARTGASISMFDNPLSTHAWLVVTAFGGYLIGMLLRLPAAVMMGPFIVSAIIHAGGFSDFKLSYEFVTVAQIVLGSYLGSSFAGVEKKTVFRVIGLSLGSSILLIMTTIGFAHLASLTSDYGPVPLILAYSPGGLAEMSLISLALHLETAFVTCHHFVRITFVIVGASVLLRAFRNTKTPG